MKKSILYLVLILSSFNGFAQSFTIPNDTVRAVTSETVYMYNNITNVSTGIIDIRWRILDHDFPADWQEKFAICDNRLCYYNSNGSLMQPGGGPGSRTFTSDTFGPGSTAIFYVLPDLTDAVPGTHFAKVEMVEGSYTKNSWYIVSKWPTGVVSVNQSAKKFALFPNPATNNVTVLHDKASDIRLIQVYNTTGVKVAEYPAGDALTKIDMAPVSPGLYFIKLVDNKGHISGIMKVDRQ